MHSQKYARQPGRTAPDQASTFWSLASQTAAFAADRHKAYNALKAQFVSTFPHASPAEHQDAMARLAGLFRVSEVRAA